jgi:hypothetical protein
MEIGIWVLLVRNLLEDPDQCPVPLVSAGLIVSGVLSHTVVGLPFGFPESLMFAKLLCYLTNKKVLCPEQQKLLQLTPNRKTRFHLPVFQTSVHQVNVITSIFNKIGANNRAQAVVIANRLGII